MASRINGHQQFLSQVKDLPVSLTVACDFRAAMAEGGIVSLETGPDCDEAWLEAELAKLGIGRSARSID